MNVKYLLSELWKLILLVAFVAGVIIICYGYAKEKQDGRDNTNRIKILEEKIGSLEK